MFHQGHGKRRLEKDIGSIFLTISLRTASQAHLSVARKHMCKYPKNVAPPLLDDIAMPMEIREMAGAMALSQSSFWRIVYCSHKRAVNWMSYRKHLCFAAKGGFDHFTYLFHQHCECLMFVFNTYTYTYTVAYYVSVFVLGCYYKYYKPSTAMGTRKVNLFSFPFLDLFLHWNLELYKSFQSMSNNCHDVKEKKEK